MATHEPSISRRRLLGAAAALPALALPASALPTPAEGATTPAHRLWTARLTRYRRLAAEAQAVAETGWFRHANDQYSNELAQIGDTQTPEADAQRTGAWERLAQAEDAYWDRCTESLEEAAVALVLTAAPGLEAVREKIAVIQTFRLWEVEMERDCLDVLVHDITAL
jgi:hypothetical protein